MRSHAFLLFRVRDVSIQNRSSTFVSWRLALKCPVGQPLQTGVRFRPGLQPLPRLPNIQGARRPPRDYGLFRTIGSDAGASGSNSPNEKIAVAEAIATCCLPSTA